MAHQHFYSRVPARVSLYNKIDGFDTFAHSVGLERDFILGELSVMYYGKLEIHNPVRLRRGEIPKVYSQAMLPSGRLAQTVITYLPKDFTGERSAYLAHSLIIDGEEREAVFESNGFDAFNPEMFIRDISAFNLTARNAGANPALDGVKYIARKQANGRAIMSAYDPEMVKSFVFAVVAAILGEGNEVCFRLPYSDAELSEKALEFINVVMSILPYSLRQKLSFVSYVSDARAYKGFNLKCVSSDCAALDTENRLFYDFASGKIFGNADKYGIYRSHAAFLFSLFEYKKIKDEFHSFVDGIEKKYPDHSFDLKGFADLIFMFWQCSGFYVEDSVVINDEALCNFLDVYGAFREGISEKQRIQAYRPFGRYLREQAPIPDGVFSRLSRLYPTECVAAKAVALDVLLGLIHVDVMRERLFAFISRNYARENEKVKLVINENLCRVFYGGFLQQRILRHFDIFFNGEPMETRDLILDKLLLSIRTPEIQEHIISFIDRRYAAFTTAQKLKICNICHEMIPECDRLAVMLTSFVNRRIATDPDIARILAAGLCNSIDKSIKASNSALIGILIEDGGFTEDVAVAHILSKGNGVELLVSLLADMPADRRAEKLIRATVSVPGITELSYDAFLSEFKNIPVRVEPSTLYDILAVDEKAALSLTPAALASFRGNIIYPAITHTFLDAFNLKLGTDGLERLVAYVNANPALADTEEYRVILDYLSMQEFCRGEAVEDAFILADGMPEDEDIRAEIAEHLKARPVYSDSDIAECTHSLLVSYFADGGFELGDLYSYYQRRYEDDIEENGGLLSKIGLERRAATRAIELIITCVAGICDASNRLAYVVCDDESGLKQALESFISAYGLGAIGFLKKLTEDEHFLLCDKVEELIEERKDSKR